MSSKRSFTRIIKHPLFVAALAVTITLIVVAAVSDIRSNSKPSSQLQQAIKSVGRLMYLPTNETPALAKVTDPSKLQGSIKTLAKSGDEVLVYTKNQELILYRPSANKIVAVQPVLIGTQPNPDLTVSVAVLNGSGNSNNMQAFISDLYHLYPNLDLVYKDNAPRSFPTTIVFGQDLYDPLAQQVAKSFNIEAGQDPLGVPGNLARLTFIIGQNFK